MEKFTEICPKFKCNTFTKVTHKLQREQASLLFQLRVGHIPLNAHLYRLQKINLPICSSCQQNSKTVAHYILHCTMYREVRRTLIYKAGRDARNIRKLLSTATLIPIYSEHWLVQTMRQRSGDTIKHQIIPHTDQQLIIFYSLTICHILFHVGIPLRVTSHVTCCR